MAEPVNGSNNFQRVGANHNAGVGRDFEEVARRYLLKEQGLVLRPNFEVKLGVSEKVEPRTRRFDLGSDEPPVLVECKSHTWTLGNRMPSAKMTVWTEAMYFFHLAPRHFRKIMFVLKHDRAGQSLATYYLRTHEHLVPDGVEFWEFDVDSNVGRKIR